MPKQHITQEQLRALVDYDPETGVFTWKHREESMFATKNAAAVWNAKFPGKRLGCFTKDARGKTSIFGRIYYLNSLAWFYVYGEWPKRTLYHLNRDCSDNRIENLAEVIKSGPDEIISADDLRKLVNYDPDTGRFTWNDVRPYVFSGIDAGCFHKNTGYIVVTISQRQYKAHRLAWLYVFGEWPSDEIDHKNGDRSDNRISNLRLASSQENNQNRGFDRRNTTGYTGVFRSSDNKKFTSSISHENKRRHLGTFDTPEAAYEEYLRAKAELHEFQPVPRELLTS
jgi:hypothetical protein